MKTIWKVLIGIGAFIGLAGSVWAVSSYWHDYKAQEEIHEQWQTDQIIAGKQDRYQQKLDWLDGRIADFTIKYGCNAGWVMDEPTPAPHGDHKCKGVYWDQFCDLVRTRRNMKMKLNKLIEG